MAAGKAGKGGGPVGGGPAEKRAKGPGKRGRADGGGGGGDSRGI